MSARLDFGIVDPLQLCRRTFTTTAPANSKPPDGAEGERVDASNKMSSSNSPPTMFVVQDSWNEEEDQELHDHIATLSNITVHRFKEEEILKLTPRLDAMIFCDSHLVQKLLGSRAIVDTYPSQLSPLYKRSIRAMKLTDDETSQHPELPYFAKLVGNTKSFAARVVRTQEDAAALRKEAHHEPVYICETCDFVSEHRIFLGEDGKIWGIQEYSEYMVGHRLLNSQHGGAANPLVVEEASVPQSFINDVIHCSRGLGFVVVDVGLTSAGEWAVVECNPPFALSSYDLDIAVYVDYCVAAWQCIVKNYHQQTS